MVCLGNICRSPIAHGIMEKLVKDRGLDWQVDSAGTGNWHVGEPPDSRAVAIARKYGLDISHQCCRLFLPGDFDHFDHIYVMDRMNLRNVLTMARSEKDKRKVRLLLDKEVVPDPYYEDDQFDAVYRLIEQGCTKIIEELIQK